MPAEELFSRTLRTCLQLPLYFIFYFCCLSMFHVKELYFRNLHVWYLCTIYLFIKHKLTFNSDLSYIKLFGILGNWKCFLSMWYASTFVSLMLRSVKQNVNWLSVSVILICFDFCLLSLILISVKLNVVTTALSSHFFLTFVVDFFFFFFFVFCILQGITFLFHWNSECELHPQTD